MIAARAISAFLAFTILLYGLPFKIQTSQSNSTTEKVHLSESSEEISLNGIRVTADDGTEIVFQRASNPRGSILFFHGCSHSATDFFPTGAKCSKCLGLPEELHLVRLALSRNLSPIAVSSTDRSRKCWRSSVSGSGSDYDRVTSALEKATAHGVYSSDQPLYAVGASSGGFFATSLQAPRFPVSAAHAIVASAVLRQPKIPHAFTHMGHRDGHTANRVNRVIKSMQDRGIPTLEFSVPPIPMSEKFFQRAFPNWDEALVQKVRDSLVKADVIDSKTSLIKMDPRRSDWRTAVEHLKEKMNDTLIADQSPLSEEMNRAWGAHEMTADHFEEVLDFFEKHGGKSHYGS